MASRKVKVAIFGTIGKSIQLETGATFGATLGSNVFTPDGVVGTPNTVRTWLGLSVLPPAGVEEDSVGITQHRLLQGLTVGDDHPQYTRKDTLTTLGDIYVRGASAPQRLGVGSVSDVLAIVAGVPTWSQAITPTWTGKHTFSVAPQVVALELGDAADTTLSRVSAGIVAVEGINLTRENRQIISGGGLTGGGDLSADRTLVVGAGTGITVNADDVALTNTAVTPGSYTNSSLTVDQQGRLTAASSGAATVPTTRTLTAGAGLTGGGDLSADRTFNVGAGTGITINADDVALDTASTRNTDHSAVTLTAGAGLTGGGDISASRTFTVGAGTGITVNADDVALANTAVTPASYTYSSITVDQQGRLTAASSGAAPQPLDATLTALAGLTIAQGDITYGTGVDAFAQLAKNTNATRYLSNTGTSNNPAWAQVALATGVSGDLPFANLTQIAGLSVLGVAGSSTADVAAITAGTDGHVLTRVSSSSVAFADISANPTGTIGLSAVNGTAMTFLRSDGTPALSQAIVPTWTGAHLFQGTPAITMEAATSILRYIETDGPANATVWRNQMSGGDIFFSTRTDADGVASTFLRMVRTGTTPTRLELPNDNQTLTLGTSDDLSLVHDGTNSIIENQTGNLILRVNGELVLEEVTLSTGAVTATLGTNAPAGVGTTTPTTWMTLIVAGTTYFIPLWT